MAEVKGLTEMREPPAAPHPIPEDGIDEGSDRELRNDQTGERDPLGDGADDDVPRGLHEHDLEQEQRQHADVVGAAGLEQEASPSDQTAVRPEALEPVERADAPEVRDRCDAS